MNNQQFKRAATNFSNVSLGLPLQPRSNAVYKGLKYLPYSGSGIRVYSDNIYPQSLAKLAYDSPTHGAAIRRKAFMVKGQGIDLNLLSPALRKKLAVINSKGETFNDIHEKISFDKAVFNGFALKVVWGNDGYIAELYHVPFTDVRVGQPDNHGDINYYVISNNWSRTLPASMERTYGLPAFNPTYFTEIPKDELGIPVPTEEQLTQSHQLIYKFEYTPSASGGMDYYPVPDYVNALDHIETEISIGIANKSLLDNGFNGKYIMSVPFVPSTEEQKKEFDSLIRLNHAGPQNNGEFMVLYTNSQEEAPKIDKIDPIDADTYLNVESSVKQSIITAHQIPAILLEYNQGGGFNNRAEEMTVAFSQYQKTKIKDIQNTLIKTYTTLFSYLGWEGEDVQIIPFALNDPEQQAQGETSLNQ